MKKPHEQEWRKDQNMMGRIQATEYVSLDVRVATHRHPVGESAALKEAASVLECALAAPDMARALLELFSDGVTLPGYVEMKVRAALRKAKVLP